MIEHLTPTTVFKCLADETRVRIALLIAREGELCVCELTCALDESQPKISRHLAMQLRHAGRSPSGQWVYYRLHPHLPDWVTDMLQPILAANKNWLSDNAASGAHAQSSRAGDGVWLNRIVHSPQFSGLTHARRPTQHRSSAARSTGSRQAGPPRRACTSRASCCSMAPTGSAPTVACWFRKRRGCWSVSVPRRASSIHPDCHCRTMHLTAIRRSKNCAI